LGNGLLIVGEIFILILMLDAGKRRPGIRNMGSIEKGKLEKRNDGIMEQLNIGIGNNIFNQYSKVPLFQSSFLIERELKV
jgi:hypothetical protein